MKIAHAALYVSDLEGARRFFVKYLNARSNEGYHNPKTGFRSYFLDFDEGPALEIMHRPDAAAVEKIPLSTGYHHIAFSVGSAGRVDELTDRLRADGYAVASDPRTTGDGCYESVIVAIEGNLIEITV